MDDALKYVERGWKVLPLHWIKEGKCSCGKDCGTPGKHPVSKLTPNGVSNATGNQQIVRDWWGIVPIANIGVATGEASNLVVLDVDPRHGGSVQDLISKHGNFTKTLGVKTGSGGYHYYFRHPGFLVRNSVGALGEGLDVRGDGGYVVAPPSVHVQGSYAWAFDADDEIAAMPGWLSAKDNTRTSAPAGLPEMIKKGVQHDTLVSIAGTVRRRGCSESEIYALISEVNRRCQEPGPDSNLRKIAASMMQYQPHEILGVMDDIRVAGPAFTPISDIVLEAVERADKARKSGGKLPGLETGFDKLDDMTLGLQDSELIVIAARPSMGKTAFAVQLARTLAPQRPGAIFSIEMAKLALGGRFLSAESSVDSQKIRAGRLNETEFNALIKAAESLSSLPIFINDEGAITTQRMGSAVSEIDELGWVIVDYLQMAQTVEKTSNRQEDVAAISRDLKSIAKSRSVPVVALAQLSRKNEIRSDKRPMLSDLRESGQIEQDADVVLFIHRPEKYGEVEMECGGVTIKTEGLAEIIVAKQRNGPIGSLVLSFEDEFARFRDYDRVTHLPRLTYADPF
ncbi:MAG: DnaB-like helicase C-terminal domain-containing protein [Candidatus Binatia bacterium]|nr:DnaB-like helicase C-terminal domain-containing protein [Candidatus Binatia bacterium]